MKHAKSQFILTVLLIAVLTIGSIGASILAGRVANEIRASVLSKENSPAAKKQTAKKQAQKLKKLKRRAAASLVAQLTESAPSPASTALACMHVPPEKPEYKGEFISQEVKTWAPERGAVDISLFIKNTGNTTWFGDASKCPGANYMRLGTAKERDRTSVFYNPADKRWLGPNRVAMVEKRVEPGEIATFSFTAKAPQATDIFREYWNPVIENVAWLESAQETAHADISVGKNIYLHPEYEESLKYLRGSGQTSSIDTNGAPLIEIDISDQKLVYKLGDAVVREYKISTGTWKTPTPLGNFKVLNKQELRVGNKWPHYYMPQWMGFSPWGHGLHALPYLANDRGVFWNEALNHIGQRVSHGCIRLLPEDAEDLYNIVEVGTPVAVRA